MEPSDPRRSGTRRVRLVTAAVAGGALVGTGALTVVVAQAHPAAAEDTAPSGTDDGTTDGTTGDPGTTGTPVPGDGSTGSGSVTAPGGGGALPAPPTGGVGSGRHGHAHTSSGSS